MVARRPFTAALSRIFAFRGSLVAAIILLPIALISAGLVPTVRFVRERVEITVHPESIDVDGLYVYENPLPLSWSQGLRIPFPVDASHPPPATVGVREFDPLTGNDVGAIAVLWFRGEPHFSVQVPAFGITWVRVRFTQLARTRSAAYLLTTTKPWGRPLERGEYVLRPRAVHIRGSNYPFDSPECLCFAREHFMPDEEWRFTWMPE